MSWETYGSGKFSVGNAISLRGTGIRVQNPNLKSYFSGKIVKIRDNREYSYDYLIEFEDGTRCWIDEDYLVES